jgi:hypothetical protein
MVVTTTVEVEVEVEEQAVEAVPERAQSKAEGTPTSAPEVMMAQPAPEQAGETPQADALSVPPAEPESTGEAQTTQDTPSLAPQETVQPTPTPRVPGYGTASQRALVVWRIAEVLLGVAAVALAIIVIWMRRQQ